MFANTFTISTLKGDTTLFFAPNCQKLFNVFFLLFLLLLLFGHWLVQTKMLQTLHLHHKKHERICVICLWVKNNTRLNPSFIFTIASMMITKITVCLKFLFPSEDNFTLQYINYCRQRPCTYPHSYSSKLTLFTSGDLLV